MIFGRQLLLSPPFSANMTVQTTIPWHLVSPESKVQPKPEHVPRDSNPADSTVLPRALLHGLGNQSNEAKHRGSAKLVEVTSPGCTPLEFVGVLHFGHEWVDPFPGTSTGMFHRRILRANVFVG
jgi:hypothetical protein